MNIKLVKDNIKKIGAPVEVREANSRWGAPRPITFDIRNIKGIETILVNYDPNANIDITALDVSKEDRHVLFLLKALENGKPVKSKVLVGHDERHWFSCGVPEPKVTTIKDAKLALMPPAVRNALRNKKVKTKDLLKRKNAAQIRQGEWYFTPANLSFEPDPKFVKKNEPISRGRNSKPHICQFHYNSDGTSVWWHPRYAPNGTTIEGRDAVNKQLQSDGKSPVTFTLRRIGGVNYAKGTVKHPDHATIYLPTWHEIHMNQEGLARGSQASVFLD